MLRLFKKKAEKHLSKAHKQKVDQKLQINQVRECLDVR